MPVHWLCNNAACTGESLAILLVASPESARRTDVYGQFPIHILCNNEACRPAQLQALLDAYPEAASTPDADGCLPLHFLARVQPDAVDLWQVLLTATEASASAAGDLASLQALMPVLLGDRGEVQGVKGRVAEMISAAPDTKGSSRYSELCFSIGSRPKPHSSHPYPLYAGTAGPRTRARCSSCRRTRRSRRRASACARRRRCWKG